MKIVRTDWRTDVDVRYLARANREAMDWINRRRVARRRRRRFMDKLRSLLRFGRPGLAPAQARSDRWK